MSGVRTLTGATRAWVASSATRVAQPARRRPGCVELRSAGSTLEPARAGGIDGPRGDFHRVDPPSTATRKAVAPGA